MASLRGERAAEQHRVGEGVRSREVPDRVEEQDVGGGLRRASVERAASRDEQPVALGAPRGGVEVVGPAGGEDEEERSLSASRRLTSRTSGISSPAEEPATRIGRPAASVRTAAANGGAAGAGRSNFRSPETATRDAGTPMATKRSASDCRAREDARERREGRREERRRAPVTRGRAFREARVREEDRNRTGAAPRGGRRARAPSRRGRGSGGVRRRRSAARRTERPAGTGATEGRRRRRGATGVRRRPASSRS